MDGIDGRVRNAVDVWLRWLPRWQIGTARPRTRICRRCTGSPIAAAAGFGPDVPHPVQHALIGRMSAIVEDAVDDYTAKNLPLLQRGSSGPRHASDARGTSRPRGCRRSSRAWTSTRSRSRGSRSCSPSVSLAGTGADAQEPREPLSDEAKAALRHEIELSDEAARSTGTAVCLALLDHRERIAEAVERLVEPQIAALVSDMFRGLDGPDEGPRGGLF